MGQTVYVDHDLVGVRLDDSKQKLVLAWGDPVELLGRENGRTKLCIRGRGARTLTGTVRGRLRTRESGILRFAMPDVQQGDGMVLQTPADRILLIDGGDNKLFARYLAARFPSTASDPLEVEAIVVTHGDADHFDGLNKIRQAEKQRGLLDRKRIFLHPKRVFHNGLVKGPSSLPEEKRFGRTVAIRGNRAIVDLFDDIREVPKSRMNAPFKRWIATLDHWAKRGEIDVRRLAFGDRAEFRFLRDEGIRVDVLGPIPVSATVRGKRRPALPLLHKPPKTVLLPVDEEDGEGARPISASHTINGHSIALRLTYGNVRFFLSGDLNDESMTILRNKVRPSDLRCEILKVPHHGSADFDLRALKAMAPVVSLISSGDESSRKEHIHPRATLMGALGRVGRGDLPLVFCTELAAFFEMRGRSRTKDSRRIEYFGFERTNFGIVHVRTDGERVLVFTHSGREGMKEAYRFRVDGRHRIRFENVDKR